jgi:hypothetical protein
MRLVEVEKLSRKELRAQIDKCFAEAEEQGRERGPLYAQAQFYMRELEHRRDSIVSIRDLLLEIAVIALIGWEIHMSYRAEKLQSDNFKDEKQVFTNLEQSSAATATTLTALAGTTQAMNTAIQDELGLNYEVVLSSDYEQEHKALDIENDTRTTVYLCGIKKDGDWERIYKKPLAMIPGKGTLLSLDRFVPTVDAPGSFHPPILAIALYLKNQREEQFVGRFRLILNGQAGTAATRLLVTRENWVGKTVNPSPVP